MNTDLRKKQDDIYKNRWYLKKHCTRCWARLDTSNYELDRPLPKGKDKKVIGLLKDELGGKIMIKFVGLRAKTYSYLIDAGGEVTKGTKNVS